jgi:hypothetical protein
MIDPHAAFPQAFFDVAIAQGVARHAYLRMAQRMMLA